MKTFFTTFALLLASSLLLIQSIDRKGFSDDTGAPSARAGSPFDAGGLTCNAAGCHTSFPLGSRTGWITSDIPAAGYTPAQTYTITATASSPNRVRFGFEISPQTSTGATAGTSIITNTQQTKLALSPNTRWVTHTFTGTSAASTPGTKTWSFNWTAPAAGTGNVTFYGAFNCANNNGNSLGDSIFTSQMVVQENLSTGLSANAEASPLLLYPNPASTEINIGFNTPNDTEPIIEIYDTMGKRIWMVPPQGKKDMTMNLADIGIHEKGIYFIVIKENTKSFSSKLVVL